ncbi:hypothetical protein ACFOSW_04690 [Paenibacillus sp. GCM10012303]
MNDSEHMFFLKVNTTPNFHISVRLEACLFPTFSKPLTITRLGKELLTAEEGEPPTRFSPAMGRRSCSLLGLYEMHRLRNIGDCFDWIANYCSILTFRRPGWLGEEKLLYEASATVHDHVLRIRITLARSSSLKRQLVVGRAGRRCRCLKQRFEAPPVRGESEAAQRLLEASL